jgi:hypothetical protein
MASATARRKFEALILSTYGCHHHVRNSSRVEFRQPAFVRLIHGRSFSSQKAEKDLDTARVLQTDKRLGLSEPSPNKYTTTSQRIRGYTKQFSSRLFVIVKDSARGTLAWAGAKVAAFTERYKNRITQNIQSSVESTKSNISSKAQVFQERVKSSLRSRLDSLCQSVFGPLRVFGNSVVHQWQTTPIWNRFFWWSLSAIAVYGMATTVPKEIVKYAIFSTAAVEKPARGGNSAKKSEHVTNEFPAED